ncbi:MAG TPA: ELM1/GtrOC1 family putative glycosyltransferase [Brevundimonas sp.]|nr:ELM1/GtrOC1 family putative glycosyltransferase [Brevundimonas sp.]
MVATKPADKFARLHADLRERGAARPFDGALESWSYEPLTETDRAARVIMEKLGR